jgi:hypothetical protein
MPNHVKSRIRIIGTDEQVKEVIEKYSTHYPETPGTTYDGSIRYKVIGSQSDYGFLDEKKNVFSRRGEENVIGVPEGYEVDMEPAWTRFPCFDKITPMPESLNITADSFVSALDSRRYHGNDRLLDSLDAVKRHVDANEDKEKGEETLKNFLTGVENYIKYGFGTWYGWAPENWGTKWNAYSCDKENDNTFTFDTAWAGVPDMIKKLSKLCPDVTFEYEWADEDTGCNCGTGTFKNGLGDVERLENESKEAYDLAFSIRPDRAGDYELVDGEYEYKED